MTGSARPLIAWASGLLALLCVGLALVQMRANGVLILASLFTLITWWAVFGTRRSSMPAVSNESSQNE